MQMIISITFISFCLILLCFSVSWVCTKRMRSESVSGPEVLVTVSALIQERVFRQRELCAADPVATARSGFGHRMADCFIHLLCKGLYP